MDRTVKVEFDGGTDDGVIPISNEILEELKWEEGDILTVKELENGDLLFSKKL